MKPIGTLGLSLGMALLCGNQALSQTNQKLLQDGLISPLVFELLERQGGQDAEGTTDQETAWKGAGHQETPTTRSVMGLFWLSFTVYRSRQIQHLQNSIMRD